MARRRKPPTIEETPAQKKFLQLLRDEASGKVKATYSDRPEYVSLPTMPGDVVTMIPTYPDLPDYLPIPTAQKSWS